MTQGGSCRQSAGLLALWEYTRVHVALQVTGLAKSSPWISERPGNMFFIKFPRSELTFHSPWLKSDTTALI